MKRKLRLSKAARSLLFKHESSADSNDSSAAISNKKEFSIGPQDEQHVVHTLIPDETQISAIHDDVTDRAASPILLRDKDFVFPDNVIDVINDVKNECLEMSDEQNENIDYFIEEQSDTNEESESPTQHILITIQKISDATARQKIMVDNMLERIENIENQVMMLISEQPENCHMPTFPLKSTEEVDQLERLLSIDDLEMITFVSQIKTVGTDVKATVGQVLRRIFTDELAMSYSWKGQRQKLALKENIAILNAITAGIQRNLKCSESDIEKPLREWLRYAKKRYFRRMGRKNISK